MKYGNLMAVVLLIIAMISIVLAEDPGYAIEIDSQITSVPEFPSILPAAIVITGFLGAVLLIKRAKEP
jgi:hypothetical protein